MKKGLAILSSITLSLALLGSAAHANDLGRAMKDMKRSYKSAVADTDAAAMAKDLKDFRASAEKAKTVVPAKMSAADKQTFEEGMKKLFTQLDGIDQLVAAKKLPEAKAELDKLKPLMKEYHKKLKV